MWAAKTSRETGQPIEGLFEYISGVDTPRAKNVAVFFDKDEARQQQMTRLRGLTQVSQTAQNFVKATGPAKDAQRQILSSELSTLFGMPIGVVDARGGIEDFFKKTSRFQLQDGLEITGEDLFQMAADPGYIEELRRKKMSLGELQRALDFLNVPANKQAFNAESWTQEVKKLQDEIARRGRPASSSTRGTARQ
jgi:hypothetical protein